MRRYQICVSGAHIGETVKASHALAYRIGAAVAKSGHTLMTGATDGLPLYAAKGAKDQGGLSIGFSPAASYRAHIKSYRLPAKEFDYINFANMEYVGRDFYMVRSSDAVITIGGGIGSLHEFTTALLNHKLCGVMLGSGGLADFIPSLLDRLPVPEGSEIIYDTDPERLVRQILAKLDVENADLRRSSQSRPRKGGSG